VAERALAIVGALGLALAAAAQTLDLEPAGPPDLGERSAFAELSAALEETIGRREAAPERLGAEPPAAAGPEALAVSIHADARRVAAAVLAHGDGVSEAAVLARHTTLTLLSGLVALDDLVAERVAVALGAPTPMERETARLGLAGLDRALDRAAGAIEASDGDVGVIDAALAAAMDEVSSMLGDGATTAPAWPAAEPPPDVDLVALRALAGELAPREASSVAGVIDRIESAAGIGAFRARALVAAGRLGEALEGRRAARSLERLRLDIELDGAIALLAERLLDRAARASALTGLGDVGEMGRMAARLDALAARRVRTQGARDLLSAWMRDAGATDPGGPRRDVRLAAARVVEVAATRPLEPPGPRPSVGLKRGWRALVERYEAAERAAFGLLARLDDDPSRLSAPEVVTAIRRHQVAAEDLRVVVEAAETLAAIRADRDHAMPAVSAMVRSGVGDRLSNLLRTLRDDRRRPLIVAELRRFLPLLRELERPRGEGLLRSGDPRLEPVLVGRHAELADRLEAERRDWLASWTNGEEANAELARARVVLHARIVRALADVAAVSDHDRMRRLDRWAAVVVPSIAVGAVEMRAAELARPLVDAALAGDIGAMDERLRAWDERAVVVRLLGRLDEAAAARPDWPAHTGAAGLVAELGPPPAGAWLADHRAALAAVGPWLLELEHADAQEDERAAAEIWEHLGLVVEPVVAELER
jgi:hypothetical protein